MDQATKREAIRASALEAAPDLVAELLSIALGGRAPGTKPTGKPARIGRGAAAQLQAIKLALEVAGVAQDPSKQLESLLDRINEHLTPEHRAALIRAIAAVQGVDASETRADAGPAS